MAIDPRRKPTEAEFDSFITAQEKAWNPALGEMKRGYDLYFQETSIWQDYYTRNPGALRNRQEYKDGAFSAMVDQAVAMHLAFEPTFHIDPASDSKEDSAASGRAEKGLQAVVHNAFERAPNYPTRLNGKQIILANHTSLLTLPNTGGMVKPKKRKGEENEAFELRKWEWESSERHWNPIKLVVPTHGEVLMDPMQVNPPVMVWRRQIQANELEELVLRRRDLYTRAGRVLKQFAGAWVGDYSMTDADEDVKVDEWWSVRWHGLRIRGGRTLFWEPNIIGIQPGVHVWGGTAISPVNEEFDLKWWVKQAMMNKVIDEVVMASQATVAHHQLLQRAAWAPPGTTQEADEAAEQLQRGLLQGAEGEWWNLPVPDLPAQSFAHKQNLEQGIERKTFPAMAVGFGRQSETETATGMVILSENINRLTQSAIGKMAHLYSASGSNILKIAHKIHKEWGDDYAEFGEGLNKLRVRDIKHFNVRADFKKVDIVAEMQSVQQDLVLLEKGLISSEYFYLRHNIEDPDGMRKEVYRDLMRQDPMYIEEGIINAFREEKMHEIADQRQAALDMAKVQRMMGGGAAGAAPPVPGGPPAQLPPERPVVGDGRPARRMP